MLKSRGNFLGCVMMKAKRVAFFLAGCFLWVVSGCTLGSGGPAGTGKDRLSAIEVKINDLVLDYVSCMDGDGMRWKYFTVPSETKVKLTFAFDEPQAGGTVVLRKATGEEMYRLAALPNSRREQVFDAVSGHYYLEIFCQAFHSEFTIEVSIPN